MKYTSKKENVVSYINPNDCKYLFVDAGPRFFEDATYNGKKDYDNESIIRYDKEPLMPFSVKTKYGWRWQPVIDLDELKIIEWPQGSVASTNYKVCDDGIYKLGDKHGNVLCTIKGYVPNLLEYASGYLSGDYITMNIDEFGRLKGFPLNKKTDFIAAIIDKAE